MHVILGVSKHIGFIDGRIGFNIILCHLNHNRGRCKLLEEVKHIVGEALQLGSRMAYLRADTPLLGNLPELDSMAVVTVITALEDHYGFQIEDDEITAETFATLGSLAEFIEDKLAQ
jgi:acyl carrier protein